VSVLAAVILAVVFGPTALLIAYALVVFARRRHRAGQLPTLSQLEVADNGRPFVDITVSPSRAPRNGNTYDPVN
jgi:hypothetical protein